MPSFIFSRTRQRDRATLDERILWDAATFAKHACGRFPRAVKYKCCQRVSVRMGHAGDPYHVVHALSTSTTRTPRRGCSRRMYAITTK